MKKKNGRIAAGILAMGMLAASLSGCHPIKKDTVNASAQVSSAEEEIINPLTGEAGYDKRKLSLRPVAVMVNNIRQSLPQKGLSSADVVYELPVEGPITRLMAVFSDYHEIPTTGSVRSARHDYVELVLPLNAFYVHFGHSALAQNALDKYKVDHVDGVKYSNTAFQFDKVRARTKSTEHCWFTDSSHIDAIIRKLHINMQSKKPDTNLFSFETDGKEAMPATAKDALKVSAPLTGLVTATFAYDPASKTYSKGEYGAPHIDADNNKTVKVKNVFLMYTTVTLLSDNYHKDIDLSKGSGYYISDGKSIPVTFKKENAYAKIKIYAADGSEVKVNPGKTWFCVASKDSRSKLAFTPSAKGASSSAVFKAKN